MEDKLLEIINHYGVMPQLKHFNSEVFELTDTIITYECWYGDCCSSKTMMDNKKQHITEEIADVMVMLEQFKLYYGISSEDITKKFWEKVDRQLDRIDKEDK